MLVDNVHPQRRRPERTDNVIAAMEQSSKEVPNESLRYPPRYLKLCPFTLLKILWKNLGLRTYKIQFVLVFKSNEHQARGTFGEWWGWSDDNLQVIVGTALHPQKVTVWSAVSSREIIGS